MFDCTDEVRNYVEAQELERAISLDVESIVDSAMVEAPESLEEALMIVDEVIDEACVDGSARAESEFAESFSFFDDDEMFD